ncbi:MAG: peptidylprolyl isomerase [Prevotella sp.]|nr:peptidylprolyl isomerase [Prevotella sp.]MCI5570984.1 peptidylprolyl isomerase [Prevotella sp.]MCI6402489.1 peptidylprolyl isomerase [Prevotella sp.]MCI7453626.1 peptidylprolyl isomerase [Prevotella sp.]MDY4752993.1 peptidylprolyl isomerase [Prevotella sp.]
MTKFAMSVAGLLCSLAVSAQVNDPVIMTVGGKPVLRSEFEYSYNKNNTDGVIDRKTVEEYVELFVNYKLKVAAALEEHFDTLTSFNKEYLEYRDQQIRPTLIDDADIEAEARKIYQSTKDRIGPDGLVEPAHILLRLAQQADAQTQSKVKQRADSIYNALLAGADFAEMARKYSEDPGSAQRGGSIGQISRGQTLKEFEDATFALKDGEMSKPVLSSVGYHIIKMIKHADFPPFDSLREDIRNFIEARGLREAVINEKIEALAKQGNTTPANLMNQRADSLAAIDQDTKYLFQEYHDGLLLYEISNREVWDKASKDEEGLKAFFKKNKKKYKWDSPRFKGIAYYAKDNKDIAAVKKSLKGVSFDKWAEVLRSTFNSDSVLKIRVEKGLFKKGDNVLVDKYEFDVDTIPAEKKDYPYCATYGKMLKAPKEMSDVRSQVTSDYQDAMEKKWLQGLRKKFPVVVNKDVVATVNKH